jgi:hypothetical protein
MIKIEKYLTGHLTYSKNGQNITLNQIIALKQQI